MKPSEAALSKTSSGPPSERHKGINSLNDMQGYDPRALERILNRQPIPWELEYHAAVSSTNTRAKEIARISPEALPLVVLADHQSAGRGRLGRVWISPAGSGIWCSFLFRPEIVAAAVPRYTIIAGVAAAKAIEMASGLQPELKWPNDLLIGQRKVGGVLSEAGLRQTDTGPPVADFVVVGIGINVDIDPSYLPLELQGAATSLAREVGAPVSRQTVLEELVRQVSSGLGQADDNGFCEVLEEWRSLNCTLGRRIRVRQGAAWVEGVARDIDSAGSLVYQDGAGSQHTIGSGEVIQLRHINCND